MERRTRTQSDLVLEEREHADRLLQEANARADRLLQEANARADRLLQEANARAARAEERADRAEQQRVNAVADGNSLADKRVAEAKENADKRVAEAKADADKRVAEAKENADKCVAEADKRVAEADKRVAEADKRVAEMKETTEKLVAQAEKIAAEADKRTAEAEKRSERAHDRLCDFSRYALNLAQETFTRSSPRLVNANARLLDTNKLTYGCQGRVLRHHDDSATFDFVVGTRKEVAAEIDVPIQEYTSRDVASIKPVTRFRSVADTDKLTKRCLKNARGSWEKTKTEFQGINARFSDHACHLARRSDSIRPTLLEAAVSCMSMMLADAIQGVVTSDNTIVGKLTVGLENVRLQLDENQQQLAKRDRMIRGEVSIYTAL